MELTNHTYLRSRVDMHIADSLRQKASSKIASGGMQNARDDSGGFTAAVRLKSNQYMLQSKRANIQNSLSYLHSQRDAIENARKIVEEISLVKLKFDDPTLNSSDKQHLNKEFLELSPQQDDPAKDEYAFTELKYGDVNRVRPHLGINPPGNGLKNTINPISTDNHSWSSSNQYAATYFVVSFLHSETTETRYSEQVKQVTQQMKSSHDNNARSISQALIADTDNIISSTGYSALPHGGGFSTRTHLTLFSILQ